MNTFKTKDMVFQGWDFPRTWVETFSRALEFFHKHIVLVLTILFALCVSIIVVHISQLNTQIVTNVAFRGAEIYTRALSEMRSWYTAEVMKRVHQSDGKTDSPDSFKLEEIPLPLEMSRALGEKLVNGGSGQRVQLISPYPFDGSDPLTSRFDLFQQDAWASITRQPDKPFSRIEIVDGQSVLRYATADRMEAECVSCHNSLPESPKQDWTVGEVSGLVEVRYPLNAVKSLVGMNWRGTYGLMGTVVILWLGGFGLVMLKLRGVSEELEKNVRKRTADLHESNRQLELEIYERSLAEETLRLARDTLEKRVQERTAKLASSNAELIREVSERKRAEEDIRQLNTKIMQRTAQLEVSNKELEAFSYSVSHDLRAPLRGIDGFSQAVLEDYHDKLDESGRSYLQRVRAASQRMSELIDAMLNLAKLTRAEINAQTFDMSAVVRGILEDLQNLEPERNVECVIAPNIFATADAKLLRAVLENLLSNAWKFTRNQDSPRIEFGYEQYKGQPAYFVKDNGAGFDMTYVHKLFGAFQRLHAYTEYPGVGVGLATVHRIIQRHGGQIWAEGAVDEGATFHFTL